MEVDMAMVVKVLVSLCCVGVCVLGLYLSYIIWFVPQRVLGELRRQGIAGPPPSFPYGNLSDIREAAAVARAARTSSSSGPRRRWSPGDIRHDYRQAVFPFYEKWRKEYGAIFTYSMGNAVFLHVSRPDVVRDIGLCVSLDLGKSSYLKATHEPLFGAGILKSNGEAWAHQRKVIAPEFFLHKVKDMVGLMVDSAHAVVKSWEDRVERNGGTMSLKIDDDIRAYSADVISRACFGSSYIKGKEIFSLIRELQKAVSKPNLLAEMTGLRFIPTKSNQEAWRLHKQVHKLILDAVGESGEGKNLLHAILRSATGGVKGGRGEAETFVVDNCKSIYFAGYESTAVTAAWCLMLLGLHPEWQDRVRDEVQAACAGGPLDSQSLQKMKKLTMVIQETMRLYPAGAFVSRQALQDIELGGMRVPKGVNIYVPVSTVHLDREVWGPDAEEFRPERFADARPQLHSYLPFGAGARTCLGQGFAMAELKVLLALVLSKFVLKLSPEYVHSPTLRLIVEPEFGVHLTLNKVHAKGA